MDDFPSLHVDSTSNFADSKLTPECTDGVVLNDRINLEDGRSIHGD